MYWDEQLRAYIDETAVQAATDSTAGSATDEGVAFQVEHGAQTKSILSATTVQKWKALTAYTAGDVVQNPDGQTVQAKATFTSGASYSPTNWQLTPGFNKAITRLGRCWVLVATGQSNNTMADTGYPTGVTDPRICKYDATNGITTMSSSEVTMTAQMARELIRYIPPTDWILVVAAAVGSTQLTEGTATVDGASVTCSWDYTNTTAAVNLHARAVTWTLAAMTLATAQGATPFIAAITFSGHEGDTPYMDESTFTTKMVNNFNRYRTLFSDSAIPIVLGSMTPEYGDARGQTYTADVARAIVKMPYNGSLSLAAAFYGPRAFTKAGEIIHFSSAGQVARGKLAMDTLLRARTNRTATLPTAPTGVRAVRSAGRFTMSWDPLWGRVTTLEAEFSKDNGATWTAGTIDNDSRLFAYVGAFPWENVRGRLRVTNSGASTTQSDWVYTDQYAATEAAPAGVTVTVLDGASSTTVSNTGAGSLYTAFKLPTSGGSVTANARNSDSSKTFTLTAQQGTSTDIAQCKVGAGPTTLTATFPAPKAVAGNHVNAATLSADGKSLKGYRGTDAVQSATDATGGAISMTTLATSQSGGATLLGTVLFAGVEHTAEQVARFQAIVADRYGITVAP